MKKNNFNINNSRKYNNIWINNTLNPKNTFINKSILLILLLLFSFVYTISIIVKMDFKVTNLFFQEKIFNFLAILFLNISSLIFNKMLSASFHNKWKWRFDLFYKVIYILFNLIMASLNFLIEIPMYTHILIITSFIIFIFLSSFIIMTITKSFNFDIKLFIKIFLLPVIILTGLWTSLLIIPDKKWIISIISLSISITLFSILIMMQLFNIYLLLLSDLFIIIISYLILFITITIILAFKSSFDLLIFNDHIYTYIPLVIFVIYNPIAFYFIRRSYKKLSKNKVTKSDSRIMMSVIQLLYIFINIPLFVYYRYWLDDYALITNLAIFMIISLTIFNLLDMYIKRNIISRFTFINRMVNMLILTIMSALLVLEGTNAIWVKIGSLHLIEFTMFIISPMIIMVTTYFIENFNKIGKNKYNYLYKQVIKETNTKEMG